MAQTIMTLGGDTFTVGDPISSIEQSFSKLGYQHADVVDFDIVNNWVTMSDGKSFTSTPGVGIHELGFGGFLTQEQILELQKSHFRFHGLQNVFLTEGYKPGDVVEIRRGQILMNDNAVLAYMSHGIERIPPYYQSFGGIHPDPGSAANKFRDTVVEIHG